MPQSKQYSRLSHGTDCYYGAKGIESPTGVVTHNVSRYTVCSLYAGRLGKLNACLTRRFLGFVGTPTTKTIIVAECFCFMMLTTRLRYTAYRV